MQTEIQWLVDVLLNSKLPSPVKDKFIARIGEVEAQLSKPMQIGPRVSPVVNQPLIGGAQSPSTQKILEQMAQEGVSLPDPLQPVIIAQTPAAAQALQARAEAIASAGKTERGRTSPRKF